MRMRRRRQRHERCNGGLNRLGRKRWEKYVSSGKFYEDFADSQRRWAAIVQAEVGELIGGLIRRAEASANEGKEHS